MTSTRIAFTMGDPAGVGPETIVKAWCDPAFHAQRRMLVIGRDEIFRRAIRLLGTDIEVVPIDAPEQAASSLEVMPCLNVGSADACDAPPAKIDARGGQAAFDALASAAQLALEGRIDALVTAPLHKTALAAAGYDYPGHTELLAKMCDAREVAMMLYLPPGPMIAGDAGLGVVHVTLHTALRDVFDMLSPERIASRARRVRDVMRQLAGREPRLAVAALNPHAGENGRFGDEELEVIAPAVELARRAGMAIEGPLPADTLMCRAAGGEFDGVVAMYHDQGHIALKLLGMHAAVNVTLGLPIIRTSVAHGTAFDLAWQGVAEHQGLLAATDVATRLAANSDLRATSSKRSVKPSVS